MLGLSSCYHTIIFEKDGVSYLMRFDGVVDDEERSYVIGQSSLGLNRVINSDFSLALHTYYNKDRAKCELSFDAQESKKDARFDRDFWVGFEYINEEDFFIEGEKYCLSPSNPLFSNPFLHEGWFSIYRSEEPGIAFIIALDISWTPDSYSNYHHVSGTVTIAKDFTHHYERAPLKSE